MTGPTLDQLIRKEVALGVVREIPPPTSHMGLSIAPFKDVQSDDVIFSYISPEVDGLAPARAEDAESELAQKDDTIGTGRASIIDWALKDHYDASDVSRYREFLRLAQLSQGNFPMTVGSMTKDFQAKLARHARSRRRKLDNRIEWLIWQALEKGIIEYNDGKIRFKVDYGRPASQNDIAPPGGLWSQSTSDPLGDVLELDEQAYNDYSIRFGRAVGSRKAWRALLNSDKWAARSGIAGAGVDPNYTIDGWGIEAVLTVFQRQTGITPVVYDAVYRTRDIGSKTVVNHRFFADDKILFLPASEYVEELDDTEVGFASTLTSPHPEGEWESGFYAWEQATKDPWGVDMGTGIKAFPVFPHLELTYVMKVL